MMSNTEIITTHYLINGNILLLQKGKRIIFWLWLPSLFDINIFL